jgi:hypothetical protein
MSILPQILLASYGGGVAGPRAFSLLGSGLITGGTTASTPSIVFPGNNVVVAWGIARSDGNAYTVSGITANSSALSNDVTAASAVAVSAGIWSGAAAAGSGVVTWTFGDATTHNVCYAVYDIDDRVLQATNSTNANATTLNQTVNVNDDGVVVCAYHVNLNSHTSVFNAGVDQDERQVIFPTNRYAACGSRLYASAATPATVTSTAVSSSLHRAATASYS